MAHDLIFKRAAHGYDWNQFHEDGRGAQWPAEYMVRHASLHARHHPGRYALDIGAGGGAHTRMLLEMGYSVTALDVSPAACEGLMQRYGKHDMGVRCADITEAGLATNAYDLVIDNLTLTHIEHPPWEDIIRCLKPGGCILTAQFGVRHESLPDSWCHLPALCDRGFESLEYVRHVRDKWRDEGRKIEFTIGVSRYINEPRKC